MKKRFYLFVFVLIYSPCIIQTASAQAGQWVWLHGTGSNGPSAGNFGIQGVPSPTNDPPALYEPCEWTDLNGKFWMYGGLGDGSGDSINNNLWMYDPVDSEWTWMNGTNAYDDPGNYGVQGIASLANRPPSVSWGVATWVDLSGNLWMFGGAWDDADSSSVSDLWEYNIASNEWTWIKGPGINYPPGVYGTEGVPDTANYPPPRSECAASWVDKAGDLWLFGGYLGQIYNDLWRYNIASNTWTWMKGSNLPTQKGFWGQMGVEDPANVPSARRAYCHWVDNAGNLWTYGGDGEDSTHEFWQLSDLWRYNPCTNNWTWMNGASVGSANNVGVFGTKCVTAPTNQPPPRFENRAAWTDANGNFWMFGGGFSTTPFSSYELNDLWKYCVSSNEWTWEGGNSTSIADPLGNWGTMDVSSPTNVPSARNGSVGWTDHKGHLYLFGGTGGSNDLWEFTIDSTCGSSCATVIPTSPVALFQSSDSIFCANSCINFTNLSTGATSWKWTFPGGSPDSSSAQNPPSVCYYSTGDYDVTLIVGGSSCSVSDTLKANNLIQVFTSPPTPVITCSNDTLYCSFDSSYTSYQWYTDTSLISGATKPYYVISQNGNYNVAVMNNKGCSIAVGITTTGCLTGVINFSEEDHTISIYPNPATDQLFVTGYPLIGKSIITVFNVLGETIYKEELNSKQEIINCKSFSSGVYFVQIANESGRWGGRFVKE